MKTKLLAASTAALGMLFSINAVSAATYTINVDYNLSDGQFFDSIIDNTNTGREVNGNRFFEGLTSQGSYQTPVNLPTLYAGDVINTTINFTRGLALTINNPYDTWPANGQLFLVEFFSPPGPDFTVTNSAQLTLLHAHGDLLIPDPVTQRNVCGACVAGSIAGHFTDSSFSFRGFSMVTTILDTAEPFAPTGMNFVIEASLANDYGPGNRANIEITHGGSGNPLDPVPLPAALPLFATGLGALGLLGWRKRRHPCSTMKGA